MQITLNGKETECAENTSVKGLLEHNGISPVNIAVAVNGRVVPKAEWDNTAITGGAKIIIIKAVQGG